MRNGHWKMWKPSVPTTTYPIQDVLIIGHYCIFRWSLDVLPRLLLSSQQILDDLKLQLGADTVACSTPGEQRFTHNNVLYRVEVAKHVLDFLHTLPPWAPTLGHGSTLSGSFKFPGSSVTVFRCDARRLALVSAASCMVCFVGPSCTSFVVLGLTSKEGNTKQCGGIERLARRL